MNLYKRELATGTHVLSLPLNKKTPIEELFPKEISGSLIEKLDTSGIWKSKEKILFENNAFVVSENYTHLFPLETIRLTLKRKILINWEVEFKSYSGLQKAKINFETGFDFEEALYLAQLSNLVYEEENVIKKTIDKQYNFEEFYYSSKHSHKNLFKKGLAKLLFAFFRGRRSVVDLQFMYLTKIDETTGKNLLVIVFQGSQEPQDWMTNISFADNNFYKRGRVHQGFNHSLKLFFQTMKKSNIKLSRKLPVSIQDDIRSLNNNTKIILTGHSLGGALATLAGCYFHEIGIESENIEIYTFGAPPIGTEDFCDYYRKKLNIYRLVNQNDVVPKLDMITRFYHLGEEIVLPSNQGEIHSCEGYVDNIIDSL